jgi:transitional endoplasmic reticulum ATPase
MAIMIEANVRPGEGPCMKPGTLAISRGIVEALEAKEGDPLLVRGKRESVAVVESVEEMDGNVVYLSRIVALNTQSDGRVEIGKPEEIVTAGKIILALNGEESAFDSDDLKRRLKGLYACGGDQIILPVVPGVSLAKQPTGLVLRTHPEGVVQVGEDTEIVIKKTLSEMAGSKASFGSLGGLKEILNAIMELELRLINQEPLEEYGSGPIKGVIIHGPSGVGKTLLLKSLANEAKVNCILLGASELAGLGQGEAERRLREIFDEARQNPPSIVCIDDLESICAGNRGKPGTPIRRFLSRV